MLKTEVYKIIENKSNVNNFLIQEEYEKDELNLKDYYIAKESFKLNTFFFHVLLGRGKQAVPMIEIDPTLVGVLNKQRYFSTSIGNVWFKQKERICNTLNKLKSCTVLFSDSYNLEKAALQSRLWTIDFNPKGKSKFEVTVIFGHCNIFPMLPYEILSVATIIKLCSKITDKKCTAINWFFHSLKNTSGPSKYVKSYANNEVFDIVENKYAAEMLRAERAIKVNHDILPDLIMPIDRKSKFYLNEIVEWHRERKNAETRIEDMFKRFE